MGVYALEALPGHFRIEPFPQGVHEVSLGPHLGQYLQYSPTMSYVGPSTSSPQSTERIGQGPTSGEVQLQRYASFSHAYRLVSQLGPRVTVHILHRSTSSMTIPFLTSSIYIGYLFQPKMTMTKLLSKGASGHWSVNVGGTNSYTFARDGENSYLDRHLTWVFPLFAQKASPLQTYPHIHLPFHSSSITSRNMAASPQKMKKEQSLL
jgi:preprotein translocase subunit SecG